MSSAEFVKLNLKEHLSQTMVPPVADGLWSLYDNARQLCERNEQIDQTLRTFQNLLTQVPAWSDETLAEEVERIVASSKCEYLDDLLMGVFLAYIRAFASLQYRGDSQRINLDFERPTVAKFVHEFYKHGARAAWKSAYLFKTHGVSNEVQARNRRDIETMLDKCMSDVINAFIPWKEISRAYFQPAEPEPEPEPKTVSDRAVSFGEDDDDEDETGSHSERPAISLGDDLVGVDLGITEEEDTQEVNLDTLEVKL